MTPVIRGRFGRRPGDRHSIDVETRHKVLISLLSQPLWITRTVESVSFVDRHTVRRRISRHFVFPEEHQRPQLKNSRLVRLPVFAVPKGSFLSCDLIDESKRYVSLPPLPERAGLSAAALQQLAIDLLGAENHTVSQLIHDFVTAGPNSCQQMLEKAEADKAMKSLFEAHHFRELAAYLAGNYVVFVDLEDGQAESPAGKIIRFELDVRFPHTLRELRELRELYIRPGARSGLPSLSWTPSPSNGPLRRLRSWGRVALRRLGLMGRPFFHFIPIYGAGSVHLDIEAADGIAFGKRRLQLKDQHGVVYFSKEAAGASSRRARFLIPRERRPGSAIMKINIRPAPGVLRNGAPFLLLGLAAILVAAACEYSELEGKAAGVTMLFLVPSLVAFVIARPSENPFVTTVLGLTRIFAILPIPLGLIAAFVLITKAGTCVLVVEACLAAALGSVLLLGRLIDEFKVKPDLIEYVEDNLTRIG